MMKGKDDNNGGKRRGNEAKNMDMKTYLQKGPNSDVQLYLRPLG